MKKRGARFVCAVSVNGDVIGAFPACFAVWIDRSRIVASPYRTFA